MAQTFTFTDGTDAAAGTAVTTDSSSRTGIANMALVLIGDDTITSIDDDTSERARLCKARFNDAKNYVLMQHPWNAVMTRTSLSKETTTPAWGYNSQFALPVDCLRVVRLQDTTQDFTIEQRKLMTNADTVKIAYVKEITDITILGEHIRAVIAARLAFELTMRLPISESLMDRIKLEYEDRLNEARHIDSVECSDEYDISPVDFLNARLGWRGMDRRMNTIDTSS